jgi:cell division protein FtsB
MSRATARRTALTGRSAVLALTLAFVIVAIALPFKIWLGQRGDITSLNRQIAQAQSKVAQLNTKDQLWSDPSYVEQQAQQRLHYVMPGESNTVVIAPHKSKSSKALAQAIAHPAAPPASGGPWYTELWKSMQTAGGDGAASGSS